MNIDPDLLSEQLTHTLDLIRSELNMVNHRLAQLEEQKKDHEARLRQLTETATQFKVLASLATGGGLLSLFSLIKMLFGP